MTTVDDLAAWLTQIWDDQERTARVEVEMAEEYFGGPEFSLTYQWARLTHHTNGAYGSSFMPGAPTPTEVLARIAADREILKRCTDYLSSHFSDDFSGDSLAEDVVKGLASAHANRPGYREEWRP